MIEIYTTYWKMDYRHIEFLEEYYNCFIVVLYQLETKPSHYCWEFKNELDALAFLLTHGDKQVKQP